MTLFDLPQPFVPRWTNHGRDRFRERFFDCTDEAMDDFVLTPPIRACLAAGASRLFRFDGMTICAEQGAICTIWPEG